jgi:hypothetical protein
VPSSDRPGDGRPDPLLAGFLEAADGVPAREALRELLARHAAPPVTAAVRERLAGRGSPEEAEDARAGALLRLAEELWALRSGTAAAIEDFPAYVAAAARDACHARLRRRFPERTRLRYRVRYLLGHHPELASWEGPGGETVGGLAEWRGRPAAPDAGPRRREVEGQLAPADFPRRVAALLREAGAPCGLEDLVAALSDPPSGQAEASAPHVALGRLWAEVGLLPRHQRAALLLDLRDAEGRGVIELLPPAGIASLADIAQALHMPQARLESIWEELPRDHAWIAKRLRVTPCQVQSLRKCARERLARRLRAPEPAADGGAANDGGHNEARERLRAFLRDERLAAEAEAPSYEDVEGYVDEALDPDARELLELRLADDPLLRHEVSDLEELRAALRPPPRPRSYLWPALAAAAGLILVLWATFCRGTNREAPAIAAEPARYTALPCGPWPSTWATSGSGWPSRTRPAPWPRASPPWCGWGRAAI